MEHTADLAVQIKATSRPKLFEEAAKAYLYLIINHQKWSSTEDLIIQVEGEDYEDLLVSWLSELVYIFESDRKIPLNFRVLQLSPTHLRCQVGFVAYNPKLHTIHNDIKAVTYHELEIKKIKNNFQTNIIFDI